MLIDDWGERAVGIRSGGGNAVIAFSGVRDSSGGSAVIRKVFVCEWFVEGEGFFFGVVAFDNVELCLVNVVADYCGRS
jgi:hypothetical protein